MGNHERRSCRMQSWTERHPGINHSAASSYRPFRNHHRNSALTHSACGFNPGMRRRHFLQKQCIRNTDLLRGQTAPLLGSEPPFWECLEYFRKRLWVPEKRKTKRQSAAMLTPTMSAHPDRTGGSRLLSVLYVRPPTRLFFGGKKLVIAWSGLAAATQSCLF
jgi:hypothetical protein